MQAGTQAWRAGAVPWGRLIFLHGHEFLSLLSHEQFCLLYQASRCPQHRSKTVGNGWKARVYSRPARGGGRKPPRPPWQIIRTQRPAGVEIKGKSSPSPISQNVLSLRESPGRHAGLHQGLRTGFSQATKQARDSSQGL